MYRSSIVALLFLLSIVSIYCDIESLSSLYSAILDGDNKKVGFLSLGNYQAIENALPYNVEVVIVSGQLLLTASMSAVSPF